MGIVEQYFLQLKSEKRRWRRAAAILTALSLVVAISVSWNLRMTGITIANGACCGQEEHRHTEECILEKLLVCQLGEELVEEGEGETQPEEEPEAEPETQPEVEPETEPETQPEAEPETQPEVQPEPEPEVVPEVQPEVEPEIVPEVQPELEAGESAGSSSSGVEAAPVEEHVHSDECYEIIYKCELEEHTHELACYSDETADIESFVDWEASLPALSGVWADDLVSVAKSQIGNRESERNYLVAEDGVTRNGITRYGQWYGNPHGDWSAMFALFCLNYAEVPTYAVPWSPGVFNMMRLAQDAGILNQPDEEIGNVGNLLFLDTDDNSNADRILIVSSGEGGSITAIGGDWYNEVAETSLSADDYRILGYINIQKLQFPVEEEETAEPEEDEELAESVGDEELAEPEEEEVEEELPESDEPAIDLDVEFPEEEGSFLLVADISNIEVELFNWQWQYSEDGEEPWTDIEGATELSYELEDTEENLHRYYRIQGREVPVMRAMTFALSRDGSVVEEDDTITSGAIAPFSINKNGNKYSVQIYALPVDSDGNRITELEATLLSTVTVENTTKIQVSTKFDTSLGEYVSAYFGTEDSVFTGTDKVKADNVYQIWRRNTGNTYYLSYNQSRNGTTRNLTTQANSDISLYLRYEPTFTVSFKGESFRTVTEEVGYNELPTVTEPGTWTRDTYTLLGWTIDDDEQNLYTYDELMKMPVKADVTYTAKWTQERTVSFNLGQYAADVYPIDAIKITYGGSISPLPSPIWKNNTVAMAFDGWYLDGGYTQRVDSEFKFYEDTILYAKWSPKEDGYYVYFMDFNREGQTPLVLVTTSVTEERTTSPYTPGNAPAGKEWNGVWYLDKACTVPYNFTIPVSRMTDYLTGANNRDLYLYPGTQDVCRAIFVTCGTKVDPITVSAGGKINLDELAPARDGYEFAGWTLKDGTPVSGMYTLNETTTFYAKWNAGYVPFEAILRIENANDTGMTQADILGTWYAKAGSQIKVKSTYSGSGNNRTGTHTVVCVLDGVEYPVYSNSALTTKATLKDVYSKYFIYNNTGTTWTDEVNWDDVYTGGEVPYSTRPISSAGDTIINFDYMRVRNDIVFTIPNTQDGGYIDVYKLQQNGLITGSVTYTGTKPTSIGQNVSATGVSATNVSWSYTAASKVEDGQNNYYTLHDMKYGQRIYEVYPVGGSWLTPRNTAYHQYAVGSQLFSSRRQDLTSDFFSGEGRKVTPYDLVVQFKDQEYIALMYAVECLAHETPDFVYNGVGYKVDTELCEVVKHTGFFAIKDLDGCEAGQNILGTITSGDNKGSNKYYTAKYTSGNNDRVALKSAKIGDKSVYELFTEDYWSYYEKFNGVKDITTFAKIYIFYYDRLHMNIQFSFGYDADGNGSNETEVYKNIAYGERISEFQYGMREYMRHELLNREGYEFAGWLDANGFVLEEEDWESMVATGDSENNTMIFIAKWEKISDNIVEYYEDRSATVPFEYHYFDDGEMVPYPTMTVYPAGWVWQEYGEGLYQRFDWDVPMYGEYGVQEMRVIKGEERLVNVIRIYGTWDDSHTKVIYDPNAPQGGIPGTAPTDGNEYTIWQSEVPVAARGETANSDADMVFVGWKLDRDGVVYQPGDHVPVRWPRTMIFTAQWAKPEDVVHLRYDPNGGSPDAIYPDDEGYAYSRNATASVWDNTAADGSAWFTRDGYKFLGWNTEADGSGTHYAPKANIVLTKDVTTLYAQWERTLYNFTLHKVDFDDHNKALIGAEFSLYKWDKEMYLLVQSLTTGVDGRITFLDLEYDTLYKLVEEKAPNGYATISKEIFFKVKPDGNKVSLVFYDSAGKTIAAPNGVSGEFASGTQVLGLTVENLRGYELPATGGSGIYLNILCGLILTLAPLVYGLSLRRRHGRRSRI